MKSMPNILKWLCAAVLFGFAATSPAAALEPPAEETAIGPAAKAGQQNGDAPHEQASTAGASHSLPAAATTPHTIKLPGRSLRFKAIAGPIRLSDTESLAPMADMATTAFILEGADSAKRPVTFALNGGPGPASAWLDLGAMGPWRLPLDRASPSPSVPPVTIDNSDTWLDFTDLVFVDPPGTGYSRILAKGDETRRHFYSVNGDIEALAVTIRKWLAANKRLDSPKFIVGESYGGFRAPKLARRLQDEEGIGVAGLVLISPVLDFGWFEGANNPLTFATRLPSQTAVARGLTGSEGRAALSDVEAYAAGPYLTDLLRRERDLQALFRVAEKDASFTGLDPTHVRKLGGRIDTATFAREKDRASAKVMSLYDARAGGFDPSPHAAASDYSDPVLDAIKTPLASAMADLTGNRLGWPVEARYEYGEDRRNHHEQLCWDGLPGHQYM